MSGYSTTHIFKKYYMQTKATVLDALSRASWKKKEKKRRASWVDWDIERLRWEFK